MQLIFDIRIFEYFQTCQSGTHNCHWFYVFEPFELFKLYWVVVCDQTENRYTQTNALSS